MYYLVITKRTPQFDPSHAPAHKTFMASLKESGNVVMSGPFATTEGGGAYVLRANSLADAEKTAFDDPLSKSGSSIITVTAWDATILG